MRTAERLAYALAKHEDRLAVGDRSGQVTYGKLACRVARVRDHLHARGIGPGDVVGVHMPHGAELIAVLLAIWQRGAAFLPLDPGYPAARKRNMAEDGRAAVVLGTGDDAGWAGASAVPLAELTARSSAAPVAPLIPREDALAYLMYTSGSTGRPKGVAVEHGHVDAFFAGIDRTLKPEPDDRWLAATSISFDPALLELIWPLTRGACVVTLGPGCHLEPDAPLPITPTHVQGTPTKLRVMTETTRGRALLGAARLIVSGGEPLTPALVSHLRAVSTARIVNLYGPTEATIWVTGYEVPERLVPDAMIPVGTPLPGSTVHIFDERLSPVEAGTVGEICLAGAQVARGYWQRPELTGERFPARGPRGERIYRTGDLGYLTEDGVLYTLGRADDQIKLAGHRIEPAEIERATELADGVLQCAVAVHRAKPDHEPQLIAFVRMAAGGDEPHEKLSDIAAHLGKRLPAYMMPAMIVPVADVPKNGAGKVDKAALLRDFEAREPDRTAIDEAAMAGWWSTVLGVPVRDRSLDFFSAGGTSVQLLILARRLTVAAGAQFPLEWLLREPTIAGMTRVLVACRAAAGTEPGPAAGLTALTAAQRCYEWSCMPERISSNANVGIRIALGGVPVTAAASILERAVATFDGLRYRFTDDGEGRLVPRALTGDGQPELEVVTPDRLEPGMSLLAHAMAVTIDPGEGPLIRGFARPEDDELVVVAHHLVADGRSAAVLGDWLRGALIGGAATEPGTAGYSEYARWERRWRDSPRYRDDLRHWNDALADTDAPYHIHPGRRLAQSTGAGAARLLRLSDRASGRVRQAGREAGASPTAVLLTLWAAAVWDTFGRAKPLITVPVDGRHEPRFLDTVGMLARLAVVRPDPAATPDAFRDAGRQLTDAALRRPYFLDDLAIAGRSDGRTDRFPVSSVMFNQGVPEELPGHPADGHRRLGRQVRFDVQAIVRDHGPGLTVDVVYRCDLLDRTDIDPLCTALLDRIARLNSSAGYSRS